jgi:hypothetical protein
VYLGRFADIVQKSYDRGFGDLKDSFIGSDESVKAKSNKKMFDFSN